MGHWSGRPSEARRDEDEGAGPEQQQQQQRGRIAGAHVNTERAGNKRMCATIEYTQRDSPGVAIEATPFPTAVYTFHHSPSATLP